MNPLVSIVIPVYNTGKFIERCLRSVCEQTLADFEIVIVDDCSPDNAMEIADKVLQGYPNRLACTQIIRLEKNVGSASARKAAFSKTNGKFITCLDSDDYLELNALYEMLEKAQKTGADLVICDFFSEYLKKNILLSQKVNNDVISDLFLNKLHGSYCNKLYKKEILNEIDILDSVNMCEDFLAMTQIMFYAKKIVYLNKAFTHYVQYNSNSYTKNISQKSIEDILTVVEFLEEFLHKKNIYEKYEQEWLYRKKFFKFMILNSASKSDRQKYFKLYENDKIDIGKMPFYQRGILWAAKMKINFIIDMIISLKNIIKKMRGI